MSSQSVRDELAQRAMTSAAAPRKGWGLVKYTDMSWVVYDPDQRAFVETDANDPNRKFQIVIGIETFKKDGGVWVAEQKYIESNNRQDKWRDVTRRSLELLKIAVGDIEGRYCSYEFRPTGRTYEKNNVIQNEETFFFVKFFHDENACVQNYMDNASPSRRTQSESEEPDESESAPAASGSAIERAATTLWTVAGQKEAVFLKQVKSNKLMMDHFSTPENALAFVKGENNKSDGEDLPF